MAKQKHLILAFTDPVEGREDDYNAFYNETHTPEVVRSNGIVRGQRYVLSYGGMHEGPPHRYLAIYEIEADLDEARAELAKDNAGRTSLPDSFDPHNNDWWFTAIGDPVEHSEQTD
jgi:hypothetical protein